MLKSIPAKWRTWIILGQRFTKTLRFRLRSLHSLNPTTSCLQTWQAWPGFESFVSISIPYQSSTWKGRNWAWLCNDGRKQTCSTGVGMHQMICQRRVSPAVGSKWKCRKNVLPYKLHLKVHLLRFRMFIWAEVFRKASKWHPLCRYTSFAWHHSWGTRSAWHPQTGTLCTPHPAWESFARGARTSRDTWLKIYCFSLTWNFHTYFGCSQLPKCASAKFGGGRRGI